MAGWSVVQLMMAALVVMEVAVKFEITAGGVAVVRVPVALPVTFDPLIEIAWI